MGFVRSSSNDGKEMAADKSQKRNPSKPATTTAEVILNECCRKCRMNKILLFAQAIVNVILIALIVILFVMFSRLKSDLNDKLLVRRPKSMKSEKGYISRAGDTLRSEYQKQSKSKHNERYISKFDSISHSSNLTNRSSNVNQNYTVKAFLTSTTTTSPPPTTTTTTMKTTTTTTTKTPTLLNVLEVLDRDEPRDVPEVHFIYFFFKNFLNTCFYLFIFFQTGKLFSVYIFF